MRENLIRVCRILGLSALAASFLMASSASAQAVDPRASAQLISWLLSENQNSRPDCYKPADYESAPRLYGYGLRGTLLVDDRIGFLMESSLGLEALHARKLSEKPLWEPEIQAAEPSDRGPSTAELMTWRPEFRGDRPLGIVDLARQYTDFPEQVRPMTESITDFAKMRDDLFIRVLPPRDLTAAGRAAERRFRTHTARPLEGLLVGAKDNIAVKGLPLTLGLPGSSDPMKRDATVMARLRAAGAILATKDNMSELAANIYGLNVSHGTTVNAYDKKRVAGGSSSGGAAATALGAGVHVGGDDGGSIRVPASFNGIVGLKPTYGRIPLDGVFPLTKSIGVVGPMAPDVLSTALLYRVMASESPEKPVSLKDFGKNDLTGLRVGLPTRWNAHASRDVRTVMQATVDRLEARGATVVPIQVPEAGEYYRAHFMILSSSISASQAKLRKTHGDSLYAPDNQLMFEMTTHIDSAAKLQAARYRRRATQVVNKLFEDVDVILTPTTSEVAFKVPSGALSTGIADLAELERGNRFTTLSNFVGNPALTLNGGYDPEGNPIGIQLMGPHLREDILFRVGFALERDIERRSPPLDPYLYR